MTNSLAIVTGLEHFKFELTPESLKLKADALTLAKGISFCTTTDQQADCVSASSLMKGLSREMEKTREFWKGPVLAAGRLIDSESKKYSAELEAEIKRVEGLASTFQAEENRRALAAIAAKADEERRANLAAIAAARDEQELLSAQIKADADAAARSEEARINQEAIAEAERNRITAAQEVAVVKPAGARSGTITDYDITSLHELYKARPDLVTIEPKRAMILAALSIPGHQPIPGLVEKQVTKVSAKAS